MSEPFDELNSIGEGPSGSGEGLIVDLVEQTPIEPISSR